MRGGAFNTKALNLPSANRNNNDHVLSFDGSMLAISDQSTNEGRSTVFTVPLAGPVQTVSAQAQDAAGNVSAIVTSP